MGALLPCISLELEESGAVEVVEIVGEDKWLAVILSFNVV